MNGTTGTGITGSFASKKASYPRPCGSFRAKEPFIPVTVWHFLFHLSYIYDNVIYERYAKNIKYQNLFSKKNRNNEI